MGKSAVKERAAKKAEEAKRMATSEASVKAKVQKVKEQQQKAEANVVKQRKAVADLDKKQNEGKKSKPAAKPAAKKLGSATQRDSDVAYMQDESNEYDALF